MPIVLQPIQSQRLADIACGDATATREEVQWLACREKRWRRIEAMLRRHNSPASNVGVHGLAAACLRIVDEPKE